MPDCKYCQEEVCVAEQCEGTITRYQSPQADAQTEAKLYRLVAELFKGSA